ncbi:MAG TPA: TadE/TadG family type IV pilus assembly protein [Hyphomicrobium sp.]|uniref:TadE/TadG family type IV pilus assembly protein n=1 Tax=Hyphomicrobium sp. TaxID=82 RepID=UPI002C9868FB|nr:TadE/TadG family type IV pilus assembly protein [Hyphomicrobium sp.]HXE01094.1 TadE/TadG family type IV pilus assembly protein [Hyphomicrobium sp.]
MAHLTRRARTRLTIPKPVGKKDILLNAPLIRATLSYAMNLKAVASSPAMRITRVKTPVLHHRFRLGSLQRLQREEDGATAVEFAIVATPFLMFIFALIGCAFYFFMMNSVEKGMDQSGRLIRTGQAVSTKMTVNQFKQKICDGAGQWINCSKLQIFVDHYPNWGAVASQPCIKNNVVTQNPAPGSDLIAIYSGGASDIVIVTACYKWDFTSKLPFFKIGNMTDGSMMMQTATAFRSEPYPGT